MAKKNKKQEEVTAIETQTEATEVTVENTVAMPTEVSSDDELTLAQTIAVQEAAPHTVAIDSILSPDLIRLYAKLQSAMCNAAERPAEMKVTTLRGVARDFGFLSVRRGRGNGAKLTDAGLAFAGFDVQAYRQAEAFAHAKVQEAAKAAQKERQANARKAASAALASAQLMLKSA